METNRPMFSWNEDTEMVYLGAAFIVMSIPIPLIFVVLMKTIHNKDHHSSNLTFKLMNLVLFFQFLQGLGHLISSPALVFPVLLKEFEVAVAVIGCMMNTSWIGEIPMLSILSVSRVLIFSGFMDTRKFPKIVKILIIMVLSWISFVFVVGCITQNIAYMSPGWEYDPNVQYSETFGYLEILLTVPCLAISYFCHITITFLIFKQKSQKSGANSRKDELRILFQSTFITSYLTVMIIFWNPNIFPFVANLDVTSKRNQAILNGFWILHCYINPGLILMFNRPLREGCKKQLKEIISRSKLSTISSSNHPLS